MGGDVSQPNWPLFSRDRIGPVAGEAALGAVVAGSATGAFGLLQAHGGTFKGAVAVAGVAAAIAFISILLIRAATVGVRGLMPEQEKRSIALVAASLWMIASVIGLAVFGTVLSAVTHHRGLGGTTFAIVGLGFVMVAGLIAWRLAHLVRGVAKRPAVAWAVFAAAGLVVAGLVLTNATIGPALRVTQGLVLAALVLGFSRVRLPDASWRIWVPGAFVLLAALIVTGLVMREGEAREAPALPAEPVPTIESAVPRDTSPAPVVSSAPVVAPAASAPGKPSIEKPDIILVTIDTVRPDHLGVYGYERKTSPNIDALASKAAVFERAYAAGPETRTALAPLATCKHLVESVRDDRGWPTLLRANEMVAERLRGSGYATGAVSSFQWISKARGLDQGFDVFDERPFKRVHPEKGVTGAHAVAQAMEAYAELVKADKPLFLWVHLFDAHKSYEKHEDFDFGNADVDRYDSEIAYLDRELSRLIERVEKGDRASKTVWIVHGSHGEAFGEHGFREHPPKLYEEVIRVPLLVRLPWAGATRVRDAVVSVLDVPSTVLMLATGDAGGCTGKSLVALAEGKESRVKDRPMLLIAYDGLHGQPPVYGWLDERVKYVLYAWREGEKARLFDLQADPGEKQDLQTERQGQAIKLRQQLDAHIANEVRRVEESPGE